MLVGVCEIGLILNPGEICWLEDSETFLFAAAEVSLGYYDICLQKEHGTICQGEFVEINEYLVAYEVELTGVNVKRWEPVHQWTIGRNPLSPNPLPQTPEE